MQYTAKIMVYYFSPPGAPGGEFFSLISGFFRVLGLKALLSIVVPFTLRAKGK